MTQQEILPRLSPTPGPNNRNNLDKFLPLVSMTRRTSASSVAFIGVLALMGWLTPSKTLAQCPASTRIEGRRQLELRGPSSG